MATEATTKPKHTDERTQPGRTRPAQTRSDYLPKVGRGRWSAFAPFVGVSREKWRQLVRDKKAPQPIKMGARCSLYDLADVHAWMSDPLNYRAEG